MRHRLRCTKTELVSDEHLATIDVLLNEAGLTEVPEEERRRLAQLYPGLRRSVDRFYEIDTGDEVTAAVFRADEGADR